MKRFLFIIATALIHQTIFAQLPEDALRVSWTTPSGTARSQAIGGAMGSLGGDISSNFVNPAGIAFYKTGEFLLSPQIQFQKDKSSYLGGNNTATTPLRFNFGTSGLVIGFGSGSNSNAFSFAVNRTANFNSHTYYQGQNNYSSYSEQFAEEFSNSGLDINSAIGDPGVSYGTRMALYTYLVDTATIGGVTQVIGQPQKSGMVNQVNDLETRGGVTEIAISVAGNNKDKFYFGGSLGVPIMNYTRDQNYSETDASGNTNNDFAFSNYKEQYNSKGFGVNLKLGMIYRPASFWRVGIAVHSPTLYAITDHLTASMVTNTESYQLSQKPPQLAITSDSLDLATNTNPGEVKYDMVTPWKFIVSGSYVFREVADVTQQKGFITADIEYLTNNSSRFSSYDDSGDKSYYDAVNSTIKNYYKGAFNFRLGGELKFNTIAARAGLAYYMSPYRQSDLKADRFFVSGGLGYRNKGIFVDLTYVQNFTNDVNYPYRLATKDNIYASVKQSTGTLVLSVGLKFQ